MFLIDYGKDIRSAFAEVITIKIGDISFQDGSSTLNEPLRTVEISPNRMKRIADRVLRVNTESAKFASKK